MEDSKKEGNIAGAIFLLFGIIILISSFEQGIFGSGKITGIFGLFLSIAGIGSFINPNIAETIVHWIKGMQKAENIRISQNQHKPINSPQTGVINGNQNINYNIGKKEEPTKNSSYNKNKIEKRLSEIKTN